MTSPLERSGTSSVGPTLLEGWSRGAERVPLWEAVYRRLEEIILTRAVEPGSRLGTKAELLDALGVAPATLNEALRMLQQRGIAEVKSGPHGGVFAAEPAPQIRLRHLVVGINTRFGMEQLTDCLAVRAQLESLVIEEATLVATAGDIAELDQIVAAMADSIGEPTEYMAHNWALHRRIGQIGQNQVVQGVYLTLLDVITSGMVEVRSSERFVEYRDEDVAIHAALVRAIGSNDIGAAREAAAQHERISGYDREMRRYTRGR